MIDSLTSADVVAFARDQRAAADVAEVNLLHAACQWADLHPATDGDEVETYVVPGGDTGVTIAGEGVELVRGMGPGKGVELVVHGAPRSAGPDHSGERRLSRLIRCSDRSGCGTCNFRGR